MKTKTPFKYAIAFCLLCFSCCPLFKIDCDDCEDVQRGTELADLLLDDFESVIIPDEDESSVVYDIIHTIINFASDIECPEEVSDAGTHMDRLQLIFSETPDFNNPIVVETQDAAITEVTVPNDDYKVISEVQFETAGFYIIDNTIDSNNDVSERDENNNNDINSLGARLSNIQNLEGHIIHITDDMIRSNSKKSGTPKYISRWTIRIE